MGARFIGTLIISGLLAAGFGCGGSDTIQGVKMNVDRDVDGLTDAEEAHHGTNPDHPDTDGDGLPDGAEVETHGTSPTDSDVDHDGVSDGAEINEHHTDPHAADSDGDGLNDGDEAAMHHTDPIHADSDGDGIDDGHEIAEGSDPHVANTDHEAHD